MPDESRMLKLVLLWTLCLFLLPLLVLQGLWTRKKTLQLAEAAHPDNGECGATKLSTNEPAMSILGLGDSVIAGVGVDDLHESLTAQVAKSIAAKTGTRVKWHVQGKNGDRVADLLANFTKKFDDPNIKSAANLKFSASGELIEPEAPDYVIVSIGVNDVSHVTSLTRWNLEITQLIAELRDCFGVPIIFLGIPPMGSFPALVHPLKFALGVRAAMLDKTIQRAAELLSDVEWIDSTKFFHHGHMATDGYHPSASGCEIMGGQVADVVLKIAKGDQMMKGVGQV